MKTLIKILSFGLLLLGSISAVSADEYSDTIQVFRNAIESKGFFDSAYGYAVFPTGFGVLGFWGFGGRLWYGPGLCSGSVCR